MSHRRAKRLRTLNFHAECGGYYPAMAKSAAKVAAMRPSGREKRRMERYIKWKIEKMTKQSMPTDLMFHMRYVARKLRLWRQ